ncbi:hypothetical protein Tsubulata_009321 [Turnera subulata]|uniref:DNA (cytosine-5-)-methyltransferase n=1 Tax=Turnera subulata TaxID=218843 RepID=A0A9Q0F2G7_9ROSI|nr:hypothetical protein Tsubulata_009321 [Turnera subulata]
MKFSNPKYPLEDEKNEQMITFMDMVKHLMPKFVLMENVHSMVGQNEKIVVSLKDKLILKDAPSDLPTMSIF